MMRVGDVVFDLDGTLVDSRDGIAQSLGVAIEKVFGACSGPISGLEIGPPIRVMVAKLFPEATDGEITAVVAEFRAHYDSVGCITGKPYEGSGALLERLCREGWRLWLLTNKPQIPTRRMLEYLGWTHLFAGSISPDSFGPALTEKRLAMLGLADRESLAAQTTTVVGDSLDDLLAAEAIGARFILAAWGYGTDSLVSRIPTLDTARGFDHLGALLGTLPKNDPSRLL